MLIHIYILCIYIIIIYIYNYIYILSKTNPGGDRCLFAGPVVTEDFFSINIDMENPGENQWFLLSLGGKTHINWLVVSTPLKHISQMG